jgi:hypothetical protein
MSPAVAVVIWAAISSSSAANLQTTATLLPHANLQTTAIYVQVADGKRVEAIDRLDPFGENELGPPYAVG